MKETAALCIIAFAMAMSGGYGFELAFLFTMAIAIVAGSLQGVLIGLGGNPIVVTLGAAGLFFGLASWWSDNLVVSFRRPHGAEWLGTGSFLGLPNITIAFILIAITAEIVLRYTTFGRQVYLVGANRAAGKATGHENFPWRSRPAHRLGLLRLRRDRFFCAGVERAGQLLLVRIRLVGRHDDPGHRHRHGRRQFDHGRLRLDSSIKLGAIFISTVDNMMVLHGFNSGPRVLAVGLMIVFSIIVFALVRRGSRVQE